MIPTPSKIFCFEREDDSVICSSKEPKNPSSEQGFIGSFDAP